MATNFATRTSGGFSFSCWCLPGAATGGIRAIARSGNGSGSNGIYIDTTGAYEFYANSTLVDTSFTVTQNVWCSLGFSCRLGVSGIIPYANGAAQTTLGNTFSGGETQWEIGSDGTPRPVNGSLFDFAFWSTVLTPTEFVALARGARPGQIKPASLIAWWPLDNYGAPGIDRSVYGNNGALTGTVFTLGPPLVSAAPILIPQNVKNTSAVSGAVFRRTLSPIGTRTGSRQAIR